MNSSSGLKRQSLFVVGSNLNLTTRWLQQVTRAQPPQPLKHEERRYPRLGPAINSGIRQQEHENSISRGVPIPLPVSPPSVPIKSPSISPHPPLTSSLSSSVDVSAKTKSHGKRVSLVDARDSVEAEARVASHRGKTGDSSAAVTSRKKATRDISQVNSSGNCSGATSTEEELSGKSRHSIDALRRQRRCSTTTSSRNKTFHRQFGKEFHRRRSILQIPRLDFPRSWKERLKKNPKLITPFPH